jgi:hypothetical protein
MSTTYYATLAEWTYPTYTDSDYEIYGTLTLAQELARKWSEIAETAIIQILAIPADEIADDDEWSLWDHLQDPNIRLIAEIGFNGN